MKKLEPSLASGVALQIHAEEMAKRARRELLDTGAISKAEFRRRAKKRFATSVGALAGGGPRRTP